MIKTFFKHNVIYTIPLVLSQGLSLLLLPIYTHYLNPVQYGALDLFTIIMALVNLSVALEISQALGRYYQEFKDPETQKAYVSTAFWFTVTMYTIFVLLSLIFAKPISIYLFNSQQYTETFRLAVISMMCNGLFIFTQNQLRWQIEPKKYLYANLLYAPIAAGISIALLMMTSLNIEAILIGQISGNLVGFVFSFYFGRKNYMAIIVMKKLKEMLSFSAPLVISSLAVYITLYIDRIAIKELLGLHALGIYGMAYKFASLAGLVISGFQSSLIPLIYKHYQEIQTPDNIAKIFTLFMYIVMVILAGSVLFSHEVIFLFTTKEFFAAAAIIPPLIAAVFLNQMYMFAPGLGLAKKTIILSAINIFGAGFSILLNFLLIPIFGIFGSVSSVLIGSGIIFATKIIMSQKYYPITYQWKRLGVLLAFIIISSYLVQLEFNAISIANIFLKSFYLASIIIFLIFHLNYYKEKSQC